MFYLNYLDVCIFIIFLNFKKLKKKSLIRLVTPRLASVNVSSFPDYDYHLNMSKDAFWVNANMETSISKHVSSLYCEFCLRRKIMHFLINVNISNKNLKTNIII